MSVDQLQEYGLEVMDDDEIREFLSAKSTGVLGLPAEPAPYMIPMSYAFDGDAEVYFTYLLGSDSRKETLSDRTDQARFLVYDVETMFNWQSVLLTGELVEIPEEEWGDIEEILTNAWRPELFQTAGAGGTVKVYGLRTETMEGIRHTGLAPGFREGVEY